MICNESISNNVVGNEPAQKVIVERDYMASSIESFCFACGQVSQFGNRIEKED